MHNVEGDEKSRIKLAQLWHIVDETVKKSRKPGLHKCYVHRICHPYSNINCKVNPDDIQSKIHLKDYTALHFSYYNVHDINTFTTLLDRGANFTVKNGDGQTALHLIITNCHNHDIKDEMKFIKSVLSAHVGSKKFSNPHDANGISHLHGACMANHDEALKLFLENGASVNETVNLDARDARRFAGYSPLHFAAAFDSYKVAMTLVSRKANINLKTAEGKTALDLFIEPRPNSIESDDFQALQSIIQEKETLIKLLLEKGAVSGVGLSSLHVACNLNDLTVAEQFLNQGVDINYAVPMESPIYPGNTALHFAAKNNPEAVKMLLKREARIDVSNIDKTTPLDICVNRYTLEQLNDILLCIKKFQKICLSDGTELLKLIPAMRSPHKFNIFLEDTLHDAIVPKDSPLWPGYTILHLVVEFATTNPSKFYEHDKRLKHTRQIIGMCLYYHKMDAKIQNIRGQTPIHLAWKNNCTWDLAWMMLEYLYRRGQLVDVVDENNLSHFFIACKMSRNNDYTLVEEFSRTPEPNINNTDETIKNKFVKPRPTRLHLVTLVGNSTIAEILLRQGASLRATDDHGLTPIHWLLRYPEHQNLAKTLFDALLAKMDDRELDRHKSSYLHIACFFSHVKAVKKFLDLGSDVNATIDVFENEEHSDDPSTALACLRNYSNYTPLHMAIKSLDNSNKILDLLLQHGADIFAKGRNIPTRNSPNNLIRNKIVVGCFFQFLSDREDMQKVMRKRLGLTRLHIACYCKKEDAIRDALNHGIHINAQIHLDSELFPGSTPLHLLMSATVRHGSIGTMVNLLLKHSADVTLQNVEKDTPIHVFYKHQQYFLDVDDCRVLLINAHKNFSVNPVNAEEISHFHLACLWHEVAFVEKFLDHRSGDVNCSIYYFAKHYAGCTPLHLALSHTMPESNDDFWEKLRQTVRLLLESGANVAAKDIYGDTPLHKPAVLRSPNMIILETLILYGGNIKSENIRGEIPLEVWPDIVEGGAIFQKHGYKINSSNRVTGEGYIRKVFLFDDDRLSGSAEFKEFLKSSDVITKDSMDRTAIHNLVAYFEDKFTENILNNYTYGIESFIKIGISIDHQDITGQTALHYAARTKNTCGVVALLTFGADINIIDEKDNSAFAYTEEASITTVLRLHMKKLQYLRIEVSQLNQELVMRVEDLFQILIARDSNKDKYILSEKFFSQVERTKMLDIKTKLKLTLFHFLSETGPVTLYPLMAESEQDIINSFFESTNFNQLDEVIGIIRLQYNKMKTRLVLKNEVLLSIRTLLGSSVPDLCEEISRFLSITDLKNVIEAVRTQAMKKSISKEQSAKKK